MEGSRLRRYRSLRWRIISKGQCRIQETSEYNDLSAEFLAFVSGIHDPVARRIVVMSYRDCASDICIADQLHYSESQIKRIKRSTIENQKEKPRA